MQVLKSLLVKMWRHATTPDPPLPRTDLFDLHDLRNARAQFRFFGFHKLHDPEEFPDLGTGRIPSYKLVNDDYVPELKRPVVVGALNPDTANSFRKEMRLLFEKLPGGVKQLFAEQGTEFKLARRLKDVMQDAGETPVNGIPELNYEHTSAYYESSENSMVIAQEYLSQDNKTYYEDSHPAHSGLHEAGHSVDAALCVTGYFEATSFRPHAENPQSDHGRAFTEAFRQDVEALAGRVDQNGYSLHYYLPKAQGGVQDDEFTARAELFAELFAELRDAGGALHEAFPRSAAVTERIVASIEHEFKKHPSIGHIPLCELKVSATTAAPHMPGAV